MAINPVSFQTIPMINTPQKRANIAKVAIPSLVTSTAVMAATKVAKNSDATPLKMSTRLTKAGIAGIATAAILAAITYVNKDNLVQGVNKVKEVFRRTDGEKKLEVDSGIKDKEDSTVNTDVKDKESQNSANPFASLDNKQEPNDIDKAQENKTEANSSNPFASPNVKMPEINLDKAIKEADNLTGNPPPNLSSPVDNKVEKSAS